MAAEVMAAVPRVHAEAKNIPSHLRLKIIHAREDAIVEPQVSALELSHTVTAAAAEHQVKQQQTGLSLVSPDSNGVTRSTRSFHKIDSLLPDGQNHCPPLLLIAMSAVVSG